MSSSDLLDLLGRVQAALDAGRAPRARKPLRDAARALSEAGEHLAALRAMELLARLELRRDNARGALTAARAAQRYGRAAGRLQDSLQLLARVQFAADEREGAVETARRAVTAAERQNDGVAEARLCLAEAEARADRLAGAAATVEAVVSSGANGQAAGAPRSQRLAAEILLQCGCPQAAEALLTAALKHAADAPEQVRLLSQRGNARLMLGRPDQAARDFRAAVRKAKTLTDQRYEARPLAALGSLELRRAETEGNAARAGRARIALERVARMTRRLKDASLRADVEEICGALSAPRNPGAAPREAARRLVALAQSTESPLLVDACVVEVRRLATLPQDSPAYAPALPARLSSSW